MDVTAARYTALQGRAVYTQAGVSYTSARARLRERALPLVELVELLDAVQDRLLRRLLHLAREEELVEDHVDLVEVEDEVELAHVAKELVEELDEEVDRLEVEQLVVGHVDAQREEEARVPPVDELVLRVLRGGGKIKGEGCFVSRRFLFAVGEVLSPLFIIVTGCGADEKCCDRAAGAWGWLRTSTKLVNFGSRVVTMRCTSVSIFVRSSSV